MKKEEEKITEEKEPIVSTEEAAPVAHAEIKAGLMPKRTFLLIVLLVIITTCLLGLALIQNIRIPNQTTKSKPLPPLTYAQSDLSFSMPTTMPTGYVTDVQISTGKNKVTVVQLEISYDPKVLTNVDIKPGTFFTTPTMLLKQIDAANGRIVYVLGIGMGDEAVSGKGTIATITFSTIPGITASQTLLDFAPKTAVNAVGYAQSVLSKTTGLLIPLAPAVKK